MDFYKSSSYIYTLKFPLRKKYISTSENYTKRVNKGFNFIIDELSQLLKKNEIEKEQETKRKKRLLILKLLEEKKQKQIKSNINRQKRIELKKKITKSVSNNNMLLNIMSHCTKFIKYLNHQKNSRNNNNLLKNNYTSKNNNSTFKKDKNEIIRAYSFKTEVTNINKSSNKNKKDINKIKILKLHTKSNLMLKIKNMKTTDFNYKKNVTFANKNLSSNYIFKLNKKIMIPRIKKSKINIPNSNINKLIFRSFSNK